MENSMIQSFDRSAAIMLSRQALNILAVFNGLHMAKTNISLAWSSLHFHPKQIHSVNWMSKVSRTKACAWWNWKRKKKKKEGAQWATRFVCVQTNVRARTVFGVSTGLDHVTACRWRHNAGVQQLIHWDFDWELISADVGQIHCFIWWRLSNEFSWEKARF